MQYLPDRLVGDRQAPSRCNISETDLSVSEEEVNQTFACWKEDLVGVTGLCDPVVNKLLLANVRDQVGTRNSISPRC